LNLTQICHEGTLSDRFFRISGFIPENNSVLNGPLDRSQNSGITSLTISDQTQPLMKGMSVY